ncbi:hypothetical protein JCM24511_04087 [Saitozyma sp. JCM 24511]|nr:hypothetical protein JCM24511_04087 [Saitozyma sp. JCM 24511]
MVRRGLLVVPLALTILLYLVYRHPKYPLDYLNYLTPNRTHVLWSDTHGAGPWWGHADPPVMPKLRSATWPGEWAVTPLRPPRVRSVSEGGSGDMDTGAGMGIEETTGSGTGAEDGSEIVVGGEVDTETPAWVMLHIFSMPTKEARRRRDLIRRYHPLQAVPEGYRHLVELKFVLGRPPPRGNETEDEWAWEDDRALQREEETHGDLLHLEGLKGGENMNEGKSWEWIRHVGREGARPAWWVLKCDDDTVPLLPNLLPWLATLDPTKPTYFGNPHLHPEYHMYYFEGMLYGFSWGVVKTLSTADVSREEVESYIPEDDRMGELIYNLPSKPSNASSPIRPSLLHPSFSGARPKRPKNVIFPVDDQAYHPATEWVSSIRLPEPDPRTDLLRVDLSHYVGQYHHPLMWALGNEPSEICNQWGGGGSGLSQLK